MMKVQAALVGFGWFAELLVRRVMADVPELLLVAAVDPSPERRAAAAALGLVAVDTLAALPEQCQAVVVLTPHDTHRGIVLQAAAAGMHVFCEKAFAVTSSDCLDMIRACAQAGVVLKVGHMQKLFPGHARLVSICQSGRYGKVLAIQVAGMHWCPVLPGWWRRVQSCGGLLYWTGIHDLDTLRAVTGSEVRSVFAATAPRSDFYTDYENAISVTLMYDSGVVASMQVAELDPLRTFEEAFEISVLLERGSIHLRPLTGEIKHVSRDDQVRAAAECELHGSFEDQEEHAYRQEFTDFARTILGAGTATLDWTSALDGLRCVETLEAIYQSASSGQVAAVKRHTLPVAV